ncbi:hypothetical protein EW026_g7937 [Hermanssonia centrifuga]|uniref:Uncharacterized protein n=1 Tax=Hermanssonia centrifuga TaxID=98765 RepID=A0A4S4K644_9APHY|nr:hypothetical protein EW026_g7937 [Hermanssonia centrifuga]
MGLFAIDLNGRTYTDQIHEELKRGKYQIIIAGPETTLNPDKLFRKLLQMPS